jgi:hypothetical protein
MKSICDQNHGKSAQMSEKMRKTYKKGGERYLK